MVSMKVKLERTIADHTAHRKHSIYRQEDGRYFVLITPTNPWDATAENVHRHVVDTRAEALALCGGQS
jgi:hypothetical protein